MISGDDVENLRIYAIVIHRSGLAGEILKILEFLIYNQSRQFQSSPEMFIGQQRDFYKNRTNNIKKTGW